MKVVLRPMVILALLCGCTLTPAQEEWNRQHNVWGVPMTPNSGPLSPFNGKDYADPNPHSATDDAQRSAYQQHQDEQRRQEEESHSQPSMPDLSKMTCSGGSNVVSGANSGMMTSSTSCHN
jgi:hypothetical protein